jgi:uncharacterized membrane protein (DUF4010 family)
MDLIPDASGLIAALAVGLLIGLERGWNDRDLPEGGRVAGLRTFALTGLLGGVLGHLQPIFGPWPLLGSLLGLSFLLTVSYGHEVKQSGNLSATTAIAMLLTLALGAFASYGNVELALAAAVIVAVLLNLKPTLHSWLKLIEHRELSASLQLLVLTVVVLPYLPNKGLGPYSALNPYVLWWAVILIAGLSLTGHFAMRLTGSQRGILWTGILGGMASSTATTLALARYAGQQPSMVSGAVSGIIASSGVMFFRMAILISVMNAELLSIFGIALLVAGSLMLCIAILRWRRETNHAEDRNAVGAMPPFSLGTAFGFSVFLALMAVLVPAAKQWLGSNGIYMLSTISGLADVDAILISLARMHRNEDLSSVTTSISLGLAILANMSTKIVIAWTTGGAQVGKPLAISCFVAMVGGALAFGLAMNLV